MKQYQPWYKATPQRFEEEKADMARRGFVCNDEALLHDQRVEFTGESKVDPNRQLQLVYPSAFPSTPPRVYSKGQLLARHQRPGMHELCIFGRNRERWSANRSGADALDEAEDVLRLFAPGAPPLADDDVPEPASALYPYPPVEDTAILVPPGISHLDFSKNSTPVVGSFRLRFAEMTDSKSKGVIAGRGVVLQAEIGGGVARVDSAYRHWFNGHPEQQCPLVWLPAPPPYLDTAEELASWLRQLNLKPARWVAFMFPEQSGSVSGTHIGWLVIHVFPRGTAQYVRAFPYRPDEREARVPGLGGLADKKVVFIGCGSMGSKIAVALAQTGLSYHGLVDPDIIKPENAVRHEVGAGLFGVFKVRALAERLIHVNSDAHGRIQMLAVMIGDANPPDIEESLFNFIASADMVIDTTGSHQVSRWVDRMCHDLGIPALYATVTNGAWGGDIVRVIPGKSACWRCWDERYRTDPPPTAPLPDTGLYAPGCEQPTFTGTTYEVGMVANLAAWVAVETLLRGEGGRHDFAGDYVRWVARNPLDGSLNLAPAVLQVPKREGCPVCGS